MVIFDMPDVIEFTDGFVGGRGCEAVEEAQGVVVVPAAVDDQLMPEAVEVLCVEFGAGCKGCENCVVWGLRVPKAAKSGVTVRNEGCALGGLNWLLLGGVGVDQEN